MQTSVELLIQQITLQYKKYYPDWEFPNKKFYIEMHKQEIINTFDDGKFEGRFNGEKRGEQYYQETFKKD